MSNTKNPAQPSKEASVLTVFNGKGGCGKTMTTMQLAGTLGRQGVKTFVIDMDPQNTSALWFHQADVATSPFPATVLSMAPQRELFVTQLEGIARNHDLIIIDCPPSLGSQVPWAALQVSNLAIIPVIPVMDNIWASRQAEELVLRAQNLNPALQARYLLSRVQRGNVYEQCYKQLSQSAKLPFFESKIALRNVYPESQIFGCAVTMLGKSPASTEVNSLSIEVANILGLHLNEVDG